MKKISIMLINNIKMELLKLYTTNKFLSFFLKKKTERYVTKY